MTVRATEQGSALAIMIDVAGRLQSPCQRPGPVLVRRGGAAQRGTCPRATVGLSDCQSAHHAGADTVLSIGTGHGMVGQVERARPVAVSE